MKRLLLLLLVSACTPDGPPLVIDDIEITPPMPGAAMSAGYLTLVNGSDTDLIITRVSSPQFGRVELHESTLEDGVSRMRRLDSLRVEAGGRVRLERGGKHLMLMQPADDLGRVTLNFYAGDSIVLSTTAPVATR